MTYSTLDVRPRADRLVVAMNRPEVRNAIDDRMVAELHQLCGELEREPKILILTGTRVDGRGIFASGADIGQLKERSRDDALRGINSAIFNRIAALPMPVIAALDGWALGGGAELALAADFRIATRHLKFGQPETGLGIIAAAGGLWRLKEIVGPTVAKEILLAGRILDAGEALDLHLVSEVVEDPDGLIDAADALADRIAEQDPLAVRLSKQLFDMPASAHPAIDNITQAICFESEQKHARMQAFLDRRNNK
ncbi:enoyl-CoA hydratase/isomerase family protein [Corynebacterium sp. CCM 9186]|uniref:enoyl-CoA hydratase/isomerase family protein n=1 Tax=Corynebacterium meridianum TaxID=2765363 RepID=UPI002005BECB|nr:enoyl-CoA hydratase/isomerase family protein [Corynebacterium meridianum]MCK7677130.1 enoyl-CoA hydratase/isomerase family protein [Corynebacterium meridianum]